MSEWCIRESFYSGDLDPSLRKASASAKSERLGRTASCLCYAYAPILTIREQPNLCQLHVVRIYLIPCNIFFEARDMIQMEAKRRERLARYRTRRLAEQSLKSKATHLKGADPVRHKLPLRLSLLSIPLVIQDRSFPSHSTYYRPEFMPPLYITNNQSAHINSA